MINLNACAPPPTSTKITGKADVGFVKDNKSTPPHQRVKAVTASVPVASSSVLIDTELSKVSNDVNSTNRQIKAKPDGSTNTVSQHSGVQRKRLKYFLPCMFVFLKLRNSTLLGPFVDRMSID